MSRRNWGPPSGSINNDDLETDETKGMTNQQIFAYREQKLKEQDGDLDELYESVIRQKTVATQIGDETESQLHLIKRLDGSVERETGRIKTTTTKVEEVEAESSTKCLWITICILALIFIAVLLVAFNVN